MSTGWAVEATGLAKSYGRRRAARRSGASQRSQVRVLDGVDLRVAAGSVFALLGPNGAGKTTTVRILATLLAPDAGRARVAGFDLRRERHAVRRAISLTGQYAALDDLQTGVENLWMMGRLSGLSRAASRRRAGELLERFELTGAADRRVATYSGGMRRRLDLAASLVSRPAVIFLDEPTTGLDPRSRQGMWEVITGLVADGVTVFLTTQYLDEADQLADRIAVMDAGKVVAEGTPAELKTRFAELRLDLTLTDGAAFEEITRYLGGRAVRSDPTQRLVGVATDGTAGHIRALLDELDPGRRAIATFEVCGATLDDVFLALTGHAATRPEKETVNV